jgi:hypothetical protein
LLHTNTHTQSSRIIRLFLFSDDRRSGIEFLSWLTTTRDMKLSTTLGGLAGACALTLLNEGVKRIDKDAPRMDLLGMNALAKLSQGNSMLTQAAGTLFPMAIAGDLVSNALYYGMAGARDKRATIAKGALLGIGAGLGAVLLPKELGLDDSATNRTTKTKLLTITWYLVGGLVAAGMINLLNKREA